MFRREIRICLGQFLHSGLREIPLVLQLHQVDFVLLLLAFFFKRDLQRDQGSM